MAQFGQFDIAVPSAERPSYTVEVHESTLRPKILNAHARYAEQARRITKVADMFHNKNLERALETCIGNDKSINMEAWANLQLPFRRGGARPRPWSDRTGDLAQFGRVAWHSPGREKRRKSARMAPGSVVRCHLAGGVAPTRSCGGGNPAPLPPRLSAPDRRRGRGNVDHARRHAVPPAMATRSSRIVLCPAPRSTPPTRSGKCWA